MKPKSCVMKKDWRYYKTCHECPELRTCKNEHKPNLFGRILETIVVGCYRWYIRRKTSRMFKNTSRRQIKNARYNIRRINNNRDSK